MNKIKSFFSTLIRNEVFKALITSIFCAILGLLIGFWFY